MCSSFLPEPQDFLCAEAYRTSALDVGHGIHEVDRGHCDRYETELI